MFAREKTVHALHRAATVIGGLCIQQYKKVLFICSLICLTASPEMLIV
jgi:hypothetical protein